MYEEKIIDLIKRKSKQTKKIISIEEAEEIINRRSMADQSTSSPQKKEKFKKAEKTIKSTKKKNKIRKK